MIMTIYDKINMESILYKIFGIYIGTFYKRHFKVRVLPIDIGTQYY